MFKQQPRVDRKDIFAAVDELLDLDCEQSTVNRFSGRRNSFLRSDSDSNTYYAFSTPSTPCSESERKDENFRYPLFVVRCPQKMLKEF